MGIKDTALWKVAREIKSCLGTVRNYSIIAGSYCLGRCSYDKMKAYFQEYSRIKRTRKAELLGETTAINEYNGKKILTTQEASSMIGSAIESGKPFMAGRYGFTELNAIWRLSEDGRRFMTPYKKYLHNLLYYSGFFPENKDAFIRFIKLMEDATYQADIMIVWIALMEEWMIRTYGNNTECCRSFGSFFSPYTWTSKLEGKKVLVIHPFDKTIQAQYKKRALLFPGMNTLPEFELRTVKAVQTLVGNRDERFATWFDALDWMYDEAMKEDFDVALIGCGAYGFPLAAKIKEAGKIAIHQGGDLQLLFGIKGRRWEDEGFFKKVFENPAWVRPSEEDRPKGFETIEGGCYW